jgi:hypothetical protein
MAHFAELDSNNVVTQVVVVNNNELLDNGVESENKGVEFLNSLFGHNRWKQTSYNGKIRKNYAGIGYSYSESLDAFISPQPFASWTLDENICQWKAPVDYPNDDKFYTWNEESKSWTVIEAPQQPQQ